MELYFSKCYERFPPFYETNYRNFNNNIVKFPKRLNLSDDAKDIINQFLDNNPKKRLGSQNGIEEIKAHPFFANIDFDSIERKKIPSPYIPDLFNDIDVENFNEEFKMKLNKFYIY